MVVLELTLRDKPVDGGLFGYVHEVLINREIVMNLFLWHISSLLSWEQRPDRLLDIW